MQRAAELPDIMPDQADERMAPVYEDIQRSLRVPFVNLIFRVLANYPDWFVPAWQALGPVVRTHAFESAADRLRQLARLQDLPGRRDIEIEDPDRLRAFNDTIHYVLPKLLLVATLLDRMAAGGSDSRSGSEADGDTFPVGIAPGSTKVEMLDPEQASGLAADLFDRIKRRHGHPLVSSYFRALGQWPRLLESLWAELEPLVGSPAYEERKAELVERAEALSSKMPAPASPAGEAGEDIRTLLAAFRRKFIPEMLIDVVAVKAMIDGPENATASPFSVAGGT